MPDQNQPNWYYADNGFSDLEAMATLHAPIVSLALTALAGRSGNILDLGCGNGALLAKICTAQAGLVPYGVELNAGRLEHVTDLLSEFAENFSQGDFFDLTRWHSSRRYALALLMVGRLREVSADRAVQLVEALKSCCDQVLAYAYPDETRLVVTYGAPQSPEQQLVFSYPDRTAAGFEALVAGLGLQLRERTRERAGLLALGPR